MTSWYRCRCGRNFVNRHNWLGWVCFFSVTTLLDRLLWDLLARWWK